jgi:hypothetical protein
LFVTILNIICKSVHIEPIITTKNKNNKKREYKAKNHPLSAKNKEKNFPILLSKHSHTTHINQKRRKIKI